jgi:uncharacterized protein
VVEHVWHGERLLLLADRAILWKSAATLIIADPHFGKAAAFRTLGVPVPAGTTASDLARLDALIEQTRARRLLVLGDLLHAKAGRAKATMALVGAWCARHPQLQRVLTRGNHDLRAGDPPADWGFHCQSEPLLEGPFMFCHEPCERDGVGVFAGHLHPALLLEGADGSFVRMPGFIFGSHRALLPAFGRFTGARRIVPKRDDQVFVVAGDEVVPVTGQ